MDLTSLLGNMDEDAALNMLEQMDDEQVQQGMEYLGEEFVLPHLEDIRQRAHEDPSSAEVRAYYEQMSPEEREEEFYETLDEFIATLVECRERPQTGFKRLKGFLRDPFTVEALLLIFENEEHIDEEYTEQLKDFGATHIRWAGAMVLPEMYDDAEIQAVLDQLNIEATPDADTASPGGRG